jgi:hypothetical protein
MEQAILKELVTSALNAAQTAIVQQLETKGLPLSIPSTRLSIATAKAEDGPVEEYIWEDVTINSLRDSSIVFAVRDILPPIMLYTRIPELDTLAEYLDRESNLGTRPHNFLGNQGGALGILMNYVGPLTWQCSAAWAPRTGCGAWPATRLSPRLPGSSLTSTPCTRSARATAAPSGHSSPSSPTTPGITSPGCAWTPPQHGRQRHRPPRRPGPAAGDARPADRPAAPLRTARAGRRTRSLTSRHRAASLTPSNA